MMRVTLLALVLALVSGRSTAAAPELLQLRLSQYLMMAPAALQITVFVARDEAHEELTIEAESEGFYRSSLISLNGTRAALSHSVRYANLPEGEYRVRVSLRGDDKTLAVREEQAEVFGHRRE